VILARRSGLILWLVLAAMGPPLVHAQLRTTEVSLESSSLSTNGSSSNGVIQVGGDPLAFDVGIKNLTRTSLRVWKHGDTGELMGVSFEVTGPGGRTQSVKRRVRLERGKAKKADYLEPGERRVYSVSVSDDTWDHVPAPTADKSGTRSVRVVFKNGARRIYSDRYALEVNN